MIMGYLQFHVQLRTHEIQPTTQKYYKVIQVLKMKVLVPRIQIHRTVEYLNNYEVFMPNVRIRARNEDAHSPIISRMRNTEFWRVL